MFYTFSSFQKPALLGIVRATLVHWCQSRDLAVYLNAKPSVETAVLENRSFRQEELHLVENWADMAADKESFGGFTVGNHLGDITGWCHFKIDQATKQATLAALVMDEDMLDLSPLQWPTLQLALLELTSELPQIEQIYLPFQTVSDEDRAVLATYDFKQAETSGWWKRNMGKVEDDDQFFSAPDLAAHWLVQKKLTWLEISVKADAGMIGAIHKLFDRYGYRKRILTEYMGKDTPDGGMVADFSRPATIRTYIPENQNSNATLEKIEKALGILSKAHPLDGFEIATLSSAEWDNLWDDVETYRVGKHFVIKLGTQPYLEALPGDIVVELLRASQVFSPQPNGLHPTTALSLEMMEKYLRPDQHQTVLDLGTGNGVLAIAAAGMGINKILGVDAYPPAAEAALQNVIHNSLQDKITIEAGSLAEVPSPPDVTIYTYTKLAQQQPAILAQMLPFDAILCNTFVHVIVGLAQPMLEALRPGGILISTGILLSREQEVAVGLEKVGFKLLDRQEKHGWVAFAHKRP